jgi:DNA invertase Pin-like site-specific DNA recombinase
MISTIQEPSALYSPANTNHLKVALYARVSMPREEEDPRAQHPENQLIPLRKYALEHGHEPYHEYVDRASGADKDRLGLQQLLRDARGHRFSLVLTTKVDRFARSPRHLYNLLEELHQVKVAVRFTEDSAASTDTPEGELVLGILGVIAQFERGMISRRTKGGIARYRIEKGRWGRPRLSVDSAEVFDLKAEGLSIREISSRLKISDWTVRSRLREEKGRAPDVREGQRKHGG